MAWHTQRISWRRQYQVRQFFRQSIWILPTLGMVAAMIAAALSRRLDARLGWASSVDLATAHSALSSLTSSLFTFVVFVSSALLLAVQLASAQLTPRIVGFMFSDRLIKVVLTIFIFSFTFTLATLANLRAGVPAITISVVSYLAMACVVCFLYLIGHVGLSLRATGALRAIGILGRKVILSVYPRPVEGPTPAPDNGNALPGEPMLEIPSNRHGAVLAFDTDGLVALARRHDCVVEVVPQVGSFVAQGDPLFRLYRGGAALDHKSLRRKIAIGRERTFEQDPAFAFRIIVDIATRALSPAINDPTTAVTALDEIHHLLGEVGRRHLDDRVIRDASGQTRLVYQTPGWEDFVNLAITEIRMYGSESIQVARRLRALLEDLIRRLPAHRAAPLQRELALLRRSGDRAFTDPEDRALAEVCDPQGVGGRPPTDTRTSGNHAAMPEGLTK